MLSEWDQIGSADEGDHVRLMIAVKQANQDWLKRKFAAVSDPESPDYGQYLTMPQLWNSVYGKSESVSKIVGFLSSNGITYDMTQDRSFIVAHTTVAVASNIFQAPFYLYQHKANRGSIVRTETAAIPAELEDHVDFIIGHNTFPHVPRLRALRSVHDGSLGVTPNSIDTAYNLTKYSATNPNSSQAIASFLKQYFKPSDLELFQKQFNLPIRPIAKVEGINKESMPGMEASLDVQYIAATGRDIPTWFVSISHEVNHGQEDFLLWVMSQLNETSSPWVHSVSAIEIRFQIY